MAYSQQLISSSAVPAKLFIFQNSLNPASVSGGHKTEYEASGLERIYDRHEFAGAMRMGAVVVTSKGVVTRADIDTVIEDCSGDNRYKTVPIAIFNDLMPAVEHLKALIKACPEVHLFFRGSSRSLHDYLHTAAFKKEVGYTGGYRWFNVIHNTGLLPLGANYLYRILEGLEQPLVDENTQFTYKFTNC